MKMKPQSTPYDPRASPSLNRSVRVGQDGAPPPPPPPPPPHMHHHHHPRHRHDNHIIMAPVYHRQSYGQPRLGPPGRPYEHSRYYHDYHRHPSTYPPPPPSPSHAPQYGSSIPPLHYRESSPEARSSPPRDGQPASPSAIDLFRTGGCTCKKSKCLKLYCQCFALSTTCGAKCKCQTCHNTTLHAEAIEEARKTIMERNPSAFDDKFRRGSPTTPSPYRPAYSPPATTTAWSHHHHHHHHPYGHAPSSPVGIPQPPPTGPPPRVNKFGCKCRRSFCLKKYCECYQNTVHCGLNCRCTNCKNFPEQDDSPPNAPPPAIPSGVLQASSSSSPRYVSENSTDKTSDKIKAADTTEETTTPETSSPETKVTTPGTASPESTAEAPATTAQVPDTIKLPESQDRMAIMAAVAMTELFGASRMSPRRVSIDAARNGDVKRKADGLDGSTTASPEVEPSSNKRARSNPEDSPVRSVVESRNPSPVSYGPPPPYPRPIPPHSLRHLPHHHARHHHRHRHHHHPPPNLYPYYPPPPRLPRSVSSYEDVIKSSGLPKSLSFRKICSKCGKTRGEHGELGFGNKCVYQDCGKCGAGAHVHEIAKSPMGILCRLTVEEGATPGASGNYERKIRDLAARAELQKTLLEDKRERVERLAQTYP